jgi:hypothetical protein
MAEVVLALSTALQLAMAAKYQLPTEGRPHKFGQAFANQIRRRLPCMGDKWAPMLL